MMCLADSPIESAHKTAAEYRKGRFGEGEVITSPWRILRDRIGWCLWGAAFLYFSYYAFRH
jgi:hypothetical protein